MTPVQHPSIELDDVRRAADVLEGVAHRTPILSAAALDAELGARILFKAEHLQRGGAFKFRGAFNRISAMTQAERERGVVAASSGNHAQAVAIASEMLGTDARILMPDDAPVVKRQGTLAHGARVVTYDRYAQDREQLLRAMANESGRTIVHPFDDPFVMAGQGTVALELFRDAAPIDVLVCPVGGGGLIAGCATAARGLADTVDVIGVEPEAGDDTYRSMLEGRRVRIDVPSTIADGLQLPIPGELTFPIVQALVDDIVLVSDDEIAAGMQALHRHLTMRVEPSGACALAAVLADRIPVEGRTVAVVISGGNVDPTRFRSLTGARTGAIESR